MRILVISNYYSPFEIGGWEQLTRDVCTRLKQRGHQVYVLTSNYRANESITAESDVARILHLESPDHIHYHPEYTLQHHRQERENCTILQKRVQEFAPDVIFVNGMWNLPVSLLQEAERLLPGRVVYYMASYWPTETDAHTAYWSDAPTGWRQWPKRLLGAVVKRLWLTSTPRNQLEFALVMCVSGFVRDKLVREANIPVERTCVVYNGIEPELFTIRPFSSHASALKLLYAGRLSPDKGVHTIIESLAYLRQQYPNLPVQLSIYGGGAPEYEDRLRRQTRELQVTDEVQFCGKVPREQMPIVFAAHDVLLFASVWAEPLARTVQEGMACGLVVIGTTTGGTPEILQDGRNGLTFEAENAAMLAEKIALVAQNRPWADQLAQEARRTVEACFTMDRMVDEIEKQFTELLQKT